MKLFSRKKPDLPGRRQKSYEREASSDATSSSYRRNQTLINKAFAGKFFDTNVDSSRASVHHLSLKRKKVFSVFLVVLLGIVGLWAFITNFTAAAVITTPNEDISKPIDDQRYVDVVQEYFNQSPFSRIRLFLDGENLSDFVSSRLPEVEAVYDAGSAGIGATNFSIKMRSPVAGWLMDGQQYYVDDSGTTFQMNYFEDPVVQIVDNSGAVVKSGEASISKRFLGFVGLVVTLVKEAGYNIVQASLPLGTTRELDVTLKENGLLVKFSIDRPAGEQVEDMNRAVKYFDSRGSLPSYIDVRVSGKAFYM